MRIRTLWFVFFVLLMLLLPPMFATDVSPASAQASDSSDVAR
jgi:hypothetical protein